MWRDWRVDGEYGRDERGEGGVDGGRGCCCVCVDSEVPRLAWAGLCSSAVVMSSTLSVM